MKSEISEEVSPEYRLMIGEPVDYKKTVQEMIKNNPQFVMENIIFLADTSYGDYIDYYMEGQKVMAIKHHREKTGLGLKESKDFIDSQFDLYEKDGIQRKR